MHQFVPYWNEGGLESPMPPGRSVGGGGRGGGGGDGSVRSPATGAGGAATSTAALSEETS